MNYYYRPLDGAWYVFRDAADDEQGFGLLITGT